MNDTQRELLEVEDEIARLTARLQALEGRRDELLREMADLDGAASSRFVAVR